MRIYLITLLSLLFISCNTLQFPESENIILETKADSIAFSYIKNKKLLGLSAGVLKNGQIVWQNGYGFRDVANKIPADSTMVTRLASITKPMTATAIMQLVERGVLELDAPIQKYLPDYPFKKEGTITIRNLLNHTSGTPTYRFISFENRPTENYESLEEATKVFRDRSLKHQPNTAYFYSSYGYTILGAIIEKTTGLTYQDYMQENIWKPAKMRNTSVEKFGDIYENKSKLYKKVNNGYKVDKITNLSIKYPAGGVQSTAGDVLRFAKAMLNNQLIKEKTKLAAFEVPEFEKGTEMEYGLGWITHTFPEKDGLGFMFYHDGHQSGSSTVLYILPDKNVAIVALANTSNSNSEIKSLARELRSYYCKY